MILTKSLVFAAAPAVALAAAALGFRLRSDSLTAPLGYRVLGRGRLPKTVRRAIQREGIRHLEEGLRIGVTVHSDRRRKVERPRVHLGAVALTHRRLVAHLRSQRVLNIPFDHDGSAGLSARREGLDGVCLVVDAAVLNNRTRGTLEYRFRTPAADRITRIIRSATADPMARWRPTRGLSEFV
jgi:hypothetical protein